MRAKHADGGGPRELYRGRSDFTKSLDQGEFELFRHKRRCAEDFGSRGLKVGEQVT